MTFGGAPVYNDIMDLESAIKRKTDIKHATLTLLGYANNDIQECKDQLQNINDRPEVVSLEILSEQATILNAIFLNYCTLASPKLDTPIHAKERYMRLALKAQSQCRTTLESLENIRNPKQIMQQNNATYQQVNT